jgi:hypothetical protein
LPWNPLAYRNDRWFELHARTLWERRGPEYLEQLQASRVPIYMQKVEPDIPMSVAFPLDESPRDYYCSSIAYMLALAVIEGKDIRLWGVDNHTDEEWAYERPCNEWWLGYAQGKGLDVWVHPDSSLLKPELQIMFNDERQDYHPRYGWLRGEFG